MKLTLLRLTVASLAILLLVELSVRVVTGTLLLPGGPNSERYLVRDPVLGRLPRPGLQFHHPAGYTITTGEHSTRSNGSVPPKAERPLTIVVGDSFAFGAQVDDDRTYSAVLEQLSGRRVINAGVSGFGIDQAVLRAELLAKVYTPDVIVLGFIPHDVLRCEMSYWSGRAKPYFDIGPDGLQYQPPPVPSPSRLAPLKWLLSASVTMDLLFPRFLHWEGPQEFAVHRRGREVACLLMERLATFAATHRTRIVVLAQPQAHVASAEHLELKDGVLACARANHLLTLDIFPIVQALPAEQRAQLFDGHMTVEGNRIVGEELARFLVSNTTTRP